MDYPIISQHQILVLNCSYCPFTTLVLSNLLHHFKAAHPRATCLFALYQCQNCHLVSTSCSLLTEHSTLVHHDKEISINCIYQNSTGDVMVNGTNYECLLCSFKSNETKNLTLHYSAFHGVRNVAPNVNMLPGAEYLTGHNVRMRQHAKHGFINDRSFIDLSRDENDNSKTDLDDSSVKDHSVPNGQIYIKRNPELQPYKCTNCGNAYSKRKYFAEHVFSCSKPLQLSCPCGRVCKWRSNFYAHRKSCAVYKQLVPGGSHGLVLRRRGSKLPTIVDSQPETHTFSPNDPLVAVTSNPNDLTTTITTTSVTSTTSNLSTNQFTPLVPIPVTSQNPSTNSPSKDDTVVPIHSVTFVSGSYFTPANHTDGGQRVMTSSTTEVTTPDRSVLSTTTATVSPASIINALNQKAVNLNCLTSPQTSLAHPTYDSSYAHLYASRGGTTNEFINLLIPKPESITSDSSYSSIVFPGM